MTLAKRILLVESPYGPQVREPVGLAYIASALRHLGAEVQILCETEQRRLLDADVLHASRGCDVVGFSATTPAFGRAWQMARLLKENDCAPCVVLGGYHGTMLHETVLELHPEFDAVIRGEGEHSFPEFLASWVDGAPPAQPIPGVSHRHGGRLVIGPSRPPIEDLDSLLAPAWDLLPPPGEFPKLYDPARRRMLTKANVASSRGCPYRCAFCSIIKFYGQNRIRYRGVDGVMEEIEMLVSRYGVECIHFCDDNFLVSLDRAEKILTGISDKGLDVAYRFNARPDQIVRAQPVLPRFIECGLSEIELGIENGSQTVLDRYAKGVDVETNIKALQVLKALDVRVDVDFILFDPFTTLDELEENVAFIKAQIPWGYPTHRIVHTRLDLYPGTQAYDQVIASGLYKGDQGGFAEILFRDPEVEEIYGVMAQSRRESAPAMSEAEALGKEIMSGLDEGSCALDPAERSKLLGEYLLSNGPLNRLALALLDKTLTLKKGNLGKPLPEQALAGIRKGFLDAADSARDQLRELRARVG